MKTQLSKDFEGIKKTADRLKLLLAKKESFTKTWVSAYQDKKGVTICKAN